MRFPKTVLVAAGGALVLAACSRGGVTTADAGDASDWKTYPSHDAIVEAAKEEGSLKVLTSLDPEGNAALQKGFMEKYPFIDAQIDEQQNDEEQKTILALQAGQIDHDILALGQKETYSEFLPHTETINLLEMIKAGTLDIPEEMINPDQPNTIAPASEIAAGVAWNKELVPESEVPSSYEDLLDPKWKGQFLTNVETRHPAALGVVWGEERMLDFAKKLAAQDPVWTDSHTAGLTTVVAGEHPFFFLTHFQSSWRLQQDHPDKLGIKLLDPVPVHLAEIGGIRKGSEHPAAALLFFEYLASDEGQRFMHELHPGKSSIFVEDSYAGKLVEGHELAVDDWANFSQAVEWEQKVQEAWGFPTAEVER